MLQGNPLSPMGWLALLAALGSAGLAYVAFFVLPQVDDAICPSRGAHTLPSGRAAELCDVVAEQQPFTSETWLVVRMLVPDLPGPGAGPSAGRGDQDWVCGEIGLPQALGMDPRPERIVVQLMAEPFLRGEPAPGITQSIEAYSIQGDACMWELL
jgi:hypothetical protein